jgi:hypothetical protein
MAAAVHLRDEQQENQTAYILHETPTHMHSKLDMRAALQVPDGSVPAAATGSAAAAAAVPLQLVDLVKPGPSGTVASTAAAAAATHAAAIKALPTIGPRGLAVQQSAGQTSTAMQV